MNMKENRIERNATIRGRALRWLLLTLCLLLIVGGAALASEQVLICGKEEHTHGEGCYDGENNLICTKPEHTHSAEEGCYIMHYTVTFNTDGGEPAVDPITGPTDTPISVPTINKTGFTFAGWSPAVPSSIGNEDLTCTATWTVNKYTITFDTAGGSAIAPITQDYNTGVTAPADPVWPEAGCYTFAGWSPAIPATMPAENMTITASWTPIVYTITFDSAGGTEVASISQGYGTAITAPANPTKEGYTFAGWNPELPSTMPNGDTNLVATWTPNEYTITFNSDGGSAVPEITAAYESVITAPENPTKEGYTFAGWEPELPSAMPLNGLTVKALWTADAHTITFDSDGGSAVEAITAAAGTSITAPANPTKEGYTFVGWDPVLPETMPAQDLTLKAQWAKTYTITFDSDGGSAVEAITAAAGASITAPANPTKEGYTFVAWNPVLPETMPEQDLALKAQWTPNTYTITFDSAGGSAVESITAAYGSEITAPANPTREGLTFAGWEPALPATMPLDGMTVVAHWKCAVTFYTEDGTTALLGPTLYEINTPVESIERPAAPVKGDFLFVTWVNIADGKDIASEIAEKKVLTADAGYKPVYESLIRTSADGLYTYRLNPEKTEATIVIWNGTNDGTPIVIPQQLDGVNVVAISDIVFQAKFPDPANPATNVPVSVVVPAGVRYIGNSAFADNPMLTGLTLPDTLEPENIGTDIIARDPGLSALALTCTQTTTLTAANAFTHNVNREGVDTPVTVTLPMNVTDIIVTVNTLNNQAGNLTIAGPFTVQAGHSVSVEGGATLNNNVALTNNGNISVYGTFNNNSPLYNLGALANAGAFNNASSVFSCYAGATVSGGISGNAVVTAHSYSSETKKCTVCGAELPSLKVKYSGHDADKVYDKTTKSNLKASDFAIEDTHGMDLRIVTSGDNTFSATYDNYNAGKRTISVTLTLEGNDAALYGSKVKTSVSGNITPKEITITPFENDKKLNPSQDKSLRQKKVFGTSDPTTYHGTAAGLLGPTRDKNTGKVLGEGDSLTGKLSREPGENVGQYRILPGTMSAGDNYTINVLEGYFVIEPKSINASDMGLAIGNQRYTGEAVKPAITLRYGKTTLEEGKDFKAEFSDNVQPGTATVKLTGIGNYTGTRETTFRILNIASAASGSGSGSGGGSSYSYSGFDDGEGDEEEGEDEEETESEGTLILGGNDYGTILFDHAGRPYSFVQYEEELPLPDDAAPNTVPDMQLTIVADPLYDEETGETIMLGDTEREKYDSLHLRLTTSLVQTLTGMGYTELVYELENADLHIPLAALLAEIPLEETPEAEVISVIEGEIDESGEIGEDVEELEMDLAPQVLKVDAYDICIEQVEVAELTERETGILQSYEPKVPGYRVRVRAVIDGEESETSLDMPVATTEEGETLVELPPADKLPEGTYPIGLVLRVLPMDEVYTEQVAGEDPEIDSIIIEHPDEEEEETYQLQGVDAVFISDIETPEDKDIVDVAPAVFHDIDGMLYAGYSVNADGIYCAGTALPEGMVSTFISSEPEGDSEEEFEDMFSTPANTLSGIGTTFTLDENGNPVVEN